MADLEAVVKAYDIRGTVPDQLDAELCRTLGAAFGRFVSTSSDGGTEVVIGQDMRPTGEELVAAFVDGLTGQGIDAVRIGLASTDMLYFASGHRDAPGAMFTASHNPAEYNGIKLCLRGARPVGAESGLAEIKAMAADPPAPVADRGRVSDAAVLDAFADHVCSFVDLDVLEPLKVVADTANGMGGLVVPAVFERLPFELDLMYGELDGTFPNHPADPINPENLRDLIAQVGTAGADVGLAFDGDADRVFLVDETATGVSGSLTTALLADRVLAREPGATVIYNLICSKTVPEVITEAGGIAVRSRVGHSYIKALMAESGAALGGEHSAHYYFRDNYRADSGLIAAVVVLAAVCEEGRPLSALLEPYRRYAASGEINVTVGDQQAVIERVSEAHRDAPQDRLDGLTVDHGDWWFNLRPSNTEPLLRLNLEARTADDCAERVEQVKALIH